MKAKSELTITNREESASKHLPVYSDFRRTMGGRGRVEIAVWENETDNGPRLGTQLKFEYRPSEGEWKRLDHPTADQWLELAKLLLDADTWKQRYLCERRQAKAGAEVEQ